MNGQVRKITDGAMMCAIVGVFLLINRQFAGMLEEFLLFLFPLPMVFYSAKYGLKNSWVVLAAMILLSFVVSTPQTLFFVAAESIIGLIYGSGVYSKMDRRRLVWITILISIAVNVITTLIYASFFGYDIVREMQETKTILLGAMDQANLTLPSTINIDEYIKTLLVVTVVITGILQGFITHMLSRLLLKRMRYDIPAATPVAYYFPPIWSGYLGFLGVMLFYISAFRPFGDQMVQNICQGVGICGMFYLLAYGMIAVMLFGMAGNPKRKGLMVILSFILMMVFSLFMIILGFLYITTDWHQRMIGGYPNATSTK